MEIELSPSRQNLLQEQQQHQDNNDDDDDSPLLASCNYNTVTSTNTTNTTTAATSINSSSRNGKNIHKTKTSHATAEAKNKTHEFQSADWIFSIPFRKICLAHPPQEAIEVPHVSSGGTEPSTATATTTAVVKGKFKGWKFSSKFTNWSLESQNILTVTYVPSIHAIPSYTNKSVGVDYVQRMFKRAKCIKSCFKKTKVYMEKYDAEDIVRVKYLKKDHVKIRGLQDCCGGVQIVLRRKFDTDTRFPNSYSTSSGGGGGGGGSSGVEGQKGKIPFDGLEILKTHGYVSTNDDDDDDNDEGDNDIMQDEIDEDEDEEEPYGAIVTFVLFNLYHEDQVEMSCTTSTNKQSKMLAPPLLWKVQMPPDPSIALEAMTVLDGSLNVHPPDYDDGDGDDDDDDRGGCRLGTFRGQVDNINDDSNGNTNYNDDKSESDSYSSDVSCTASHPTNIYINGYQSWSFSGSVTQGDEQPKSAMPEFLSKAFNYGADVPPPVHRDEQDADDDDEEEWVGNEGSGVGGGGTEPLMRRSGGYVRACPKDGSETCNFQKLTDYKSDFFTCISCMDKEDCSNHGTEEILDDSPIQNCILDEHGGPAIVLGFLSQRCQYGLITFDSDLCCVAMHASFQRTIASKSKGIATDWAYCQILPGGFYDEEPMAFYLNAVSAYNGARPFQNFPPLTGWCSWYHYYENIDSESLNSNFTRLKDLNSTITSDAVIIDDGYITAWGDWDSLKPKNFPKIKGGMKHLADEIRRNGMTPGLWIAPFACDKHSKLAKEHPDWIIRNDEGRFANSSNCGKFFYGLDATNPAVREYAFKCIRRAVKEWGFRVLKLDFLYAACLQGNGKYDITMTRAETMYLALQTLRAAAGPDTFIIGCGCPIGPAIGLVDANRVSADTGPTWYPDFPLPWWDHGTLPSLRAMVRNTVTRSSLGHRFWHNDPDCILLGNTTRLTKVEIMSAATVIAMTGGMLLLSDDLSKLENDRLQIATRIYPVTGITAVPLDLHNTSKSGVPCIMRMWCTDMMEMEIGDISSTQLTTANSKRTSFVPNEPWRNPWKRQRNCLPVAKGLGTWSLVSLSNWLDEPTVVSIPIEATLPPKEHGMSKNQLHLGYHVFSFWSEKYHWVAADQAYKTISKSLEPHQSEIFHVKPMSLDQCQYIGSDLHFTCGFEVEEFISTADSVQLKLRSALKRSGLIYLYIPCYAENLTITCNGNSSGKGEVIFKTPKIWHNQTFYGGQVIRIWTKINADGSESDGRITVKVVEDE
mmetsp:Transcript_5067/g.9624  ORF Transcript_5067/g.9624 Transcript_5067/m.9624 type:complete len:1254 (-) Transcript_5067:186-3947(-)